MKDEHKIQNTILLKKLIVITIIMFFFGYALVPIYKKICDVTGVNFITKKEQNIENTQVDISRNINIEFDSNSRGKFGWKLEAKEKKISVHPGQLIQTEYFLHNPSRHSVSAQAIPSYGPQIAAKYISKLECFCFRQQEIKPGQTLRLPVLFKVSSELPKEIHTITLSYTMFEIGGTNNTKIKDRVEINEFIKSST